MTSSRCWPSAVQQPGQAECASTCVPYNILRYPTVPYGSTLQYPAVPCSTLQYPAVPCSAQQYVGRALYSSLHFDHSAAPAVDIDLLSFGATTNRASCVRCTGRDPREMEIGALARARGVDMRTWVWQRRPQSQYRSCSSGSSGPRTEVAIIPKTLLCESTFTRIGGCNNKPVARGTQRTLGINPARNVPHGPQRPGYHKADNIKPLPGKAFGPVGSLGQ